MHRQGGAVGDLRFQRRDIDPAANQEQRLRRCGQPVQSGNHGAQFGDDIGGVQVAAGYHHHRAVGGPHDRQRSGGAIEEHQGGVLVAASAPDRLRQRTGSVQFGNQDHVVNAVGPQDLREPGRRGMIGPDHPGGDNPVAVLGSAVSGTENRRVHRRSRIIGAQLDAMMVDGDPAGVGPLDQHHPNCRGCHRHTENDVHVPLRWLNR